MCISVLSTAHPDYPFILLSNRDEFLSRPTAPAHWWDSPHEHVLGGRDLQRPERGTWLAITKDGRIAILTNFKEEGVEVAREKSRGGIVNAYITQPLNAAESVEQFVSRLIHDVGIHDVGGFTLLIGELRVPQDEKLPGLAVVSNRTESAEGLNKIATSTGKTLGLSNSHYGDASWPKVVQGEKLLQDAVTTSVDRQSSQYEQLESLFNILSTNNMPPQRNGEAREVYVQQMRNSIFVPPIGGETIDTQPADKIAAANGASLPSNGRVKVGEGSYGTTKQTVILVHKSGNVTFVERTLYDGEGKAVTGNERQRTFEFSIEGWSV